jgi:hypothetical protein
MGEEVNFWSSSFARLTASVREIEPNLGNSVFPEPKVLAIRFLKLEPKTESKNRTESPRLLFLVNFII